MISWTRALPGEPDWQLWQWYEHVYEIGRWTRPVVVPLDDGDATETPPQGPLVPQEETQ